MVAVTRGFGILGLAVGRAVSAAGARVALIDRVAPPDPQKLPEELRGALLVGNVDLTIYEAARESLEFVVEHFDRIDVIANIAGGFCWQTLADGSVDMGQVVSD